MSEDRKQRRLERIEWLAGHRDLWPLGLESIVKAMKADGLYAQSTNAVDTCVQDMIEQIKRSVM